MCLVEASFGDHVKEIATASAGEQDLRCPTGPESIDLSDERTEMTEPLESVRSRSS